MRLLRRTLELRLAAFPCASEWVCDKQEFA